MKKTIKSVTPLQLGKMLALLYALFSLVMLPFMLIPLFAPNKPVGQAPPVIFVVLMPVLYTGLGFVFGFIGAHLYNFCARRIGGIEIELDGQETGNVSI